MISAIPYTIKVVTGEERDMGTESNAFIKLFGPKKKQTGKLHLELAQKKRFEPGSMEIFSLEAVDVKEVKEIEVRLAKICSPKFFLTQTVNEFSSEVCEHNNKHLILCLHTRADWPRWRYPWERLVREGSGDRHADEGQTLLLHLQEVARARQRRRENFEKLHIARWRKLNDCLQTK